MNAKEAAERTLKALKIIEFSKTINGKTVKIDELIAQVSAFGRDEVKYDDLTSEMASRLKDIYKEKGYLVSKHTYDWPECRYALIISWSHLIN